MDAGYDSKGSRLDIDPADQLSVVLSWLVGKKTGGVSPVAKFLGAHSASAVRNLRIMFRWQNDIMKIEHLSGMLQGKTEAEKKKSLEKIMAEFRAKIHSWGRFTGISYTLVCPKASIQLARLYYELFGEDYISGHRKAFPDDPIYTNPVYAGYYKTDELALYSP